MTENAISVQESDASNVEQTPFDTDAEGARGDTPTCACCGAELAASFSVGGTVPIKSASFGCFSDDCAGAKGGATYVFVTGDEIDESDRRSRYRDATNTGWVAYEHDDNGDLVRDDDGNAVKQYHHQFASPQSPASVAKLINDTYPAGEYVVQRTDTYEATVTFPASASGPHADRLAARYTVNGEIWPAFDVEVHGERDRPQIVIRRRWNVDVEDALEGDQ